MQPVSEQCLLLLVLLKIFNKSDKAKKAYLYMFVQFKYYIIIKFPKKAAFLLSGHTGHFDSTKTLSAFSRLGDGHQHGVGAIASKGRSKMQELGSSAHCLSY